MYKMTFSKGDMHHPHHPHRRHLDGPDVAHPITVLLLLAGLWILLVMSIG